ncbi:HNH endonuclease signature motif containing protein [Morganella morganii subsp. sibonii]
MITHSSLLESLHYNPDNGLFTWIKRVSNRVKVGEIAGSLSDTGYIDIRFKGKLFRAHRLAWFYVHNKWPDDVIDHINNIKTDNRLCNLRDVPVTVNASNLSKKSSSSSGYTGVTWCKSSRKWRVKIQVNGRHFHIGRYERICDAVQAYERAKAIVIINKTNSSIGRDLIRDGSEVRGLTFYREKHQEAA